MEIGEPHLFGAEREVFEQYLRKSRRYLEFGCGGSSLLAVREGVDIVVVVDSDPAWVERLSAHADVAPRILDGSVSVVHADIGPVTNWGHPADRAAIDRWPNYIAAAWEEWRRRGLQPDLVFVDGRFRVACCLSVMVACGWLGRAAPMVMLHDFTPDRPRYKDVLEFFTIEASAGSLACLRMRPGLSPPYVLPELLARQFDPE